MRMDPAERAAARLFDPVMMELGYELVRVKLYSGARRTLQVMAERADGGMDIDDCTILSRALNDLLAADDPIGGDYALEVSSPGVDRPLTREKDFARFAGHMAKLELERPVEGRKRYRGRLAGVDEDGILIDLDGETETAVIPFELIGAAKLLMTDELMRESLRAGSGHGVEESEPSSGAGPDTDKLDTGPDPKSHGEST